jgi:predicted phage-related endonuclease
VITLEQLERRRSYVCASDVAAVLGKDKYKTREQLIKEKLEGYSAPMGKAMSAGTFLEGGILDWCEWKLSQDRDTPVKFERHVMTIHPNGFMAANFDGICIVLKEIAESKTTGLTGPCDPEYGRAGTDKLPIRVHLQAHAQMMCAGPEYRIVWVPVLRGEGKGFGLYRVDRDDGICAKIEARCKIFWETEILPKKTVIQTAA